MPVQPGRVARVLLTDTTVRAPQGIPELVKRKMYYPYYVPLISKDQ
jgi:hypothetical protein